MRSSSFRLRAGTIAAAAACLGACLLAAPPPATAAVVASGSIVYAKGGNIFLTTPDGTNQKQVTTDGGIPTSDHTGDTGYSVPSESDDGTVVAVRNQQMDKGQPDEYTQGFLWVMDRSGKLIRKFKPPQFDYIGGAPCAAAAQQLPLGLINAQISPDGKYIAYTAHTYVQSASSCEVYTGYGSWVVKADGSGAVQLSAGGTTASIEIGSWTADSSRLLVDRADFGSVADYVAEPPGFATTEWTAPSDYIDSTYGQPDVRSGVLVTEGYSETSSQDAVRLWSSTGFDSPPSGKCEFTSPVSSSDELSRPGLSPDGSYAVWEDSDSSGGVSSSGQGIYLAPASSTLAGGAACTQAQPTMLVAGGEDPFWTPAGIYGPPAVTFTSTPPRYTADSDVSLSFEASDPDPARTNISFTCSLDGAAPQACSSPVQLTGLSDGSHSFEVIADDGAQTGSARISWLVDRSAPSVTLTGPRAAVTLGSAARVSWSGHDAGAGVGHYEVRYRRAAYDGEFSGWTVPASWQSLSGTAVTARGLVPGDQYCYSVRAVDRAGNASAWTAARCTTVPLDDRSLAPSRGWSRASGNRYFRGTVTTTKNRNASLTRTGVSGISQVGLVAESCPTCGEVGVYLGSRLLATINLRGARTRYRVVTLLRPISAARGNVTVKALTGGKLVAIDGLVLSHT